jgi:hypothetical protein
MGKVHIHLKELTMPKRPLSAYNIYFKIQRYLIINDKPDIENWMEIDPIRKQVDRLLSIKTGNKTKRLHRKTHGKISFAALGKTIGTRWRNCSIEIKTKFEEIAEVERKKYYKSIQENRNKMKKNASIASIKIGSYEQYTGTPKVEKKVVNATRTKSSSPSLNAPTSPNNVQNFVDEERTHNPTIFPVSSHPCKSSDSPNESITYTSSCIIEPLPFRSEPLSPSDLDKIDKETCEYLASALGSESGYM